MALSPRQIVPHKAFGRRVSQGRESPQPQPKLVASQPDAAKEHLSEAWPEQIPGLANDTVALHAGESVRPDREVHQDGQEDRPLDTGHVISKSFAVMGRNAVTFTALIAAAAAPNRLVYHLGGEALSPLITALGCFVLYAAVFHGASGDMKGEPVRFTDCLRAGFRGLQSAYDSITLTVLSVWLLLTLPCIGLATGWAVAAPAALAEGVGLRAALARSVKLTAPHRPQVQVLVLLLSLLAISRGLMMMPIWGVPAEGLAVFLVGNWLFPLLLTAFTAASGAVLYHTLAATRTAASVGEQLTLF